MQCHICNGESSKGFLLASGFCCSEDCAQIARSRIEHYHDELLAEPVGETPDLLELRDFDRWSLKLAVQILDGATKEQRAKLSQNNPIMLVPEQLSLELKDKILAHIGNEWISTAEARGHERIFYGGTFMFRKPIPQQVIFDAARKAQVLQ